MAPMAIEKTVIATWTVPMKIDLSAYPAIQAYQKRVGARPGVQAAMSAEGLPAA